MLVNRLTLVAALVVGLLAMARASQAAITGPYTADANTLHLWHIDEAALNVADSGTGNIALTSLGSGGGNSLGNASYPGFGNAYGGVATLETGLLALPFANGAADNTPTATFWNSTTGAFTFELIMRVDFDPAALADGFGGQLVTMENETGGTAAVRSWQFLFIKTAGVFNLQFEPIVAAGLPSSPISVVQGHWYHAAVTYNGNDNVAGNLQFYWTDMGTDALPDGSAVVAASAGGTLLTADLTGGNADFTIGAEGRQNSSLSNPNSGQWLGRIDEVRISDVARGADQFIFVPEPSAIVLVLIGGGVGLIYRFGGQRRRA
jgi:hypothetical protein